MLLLGAWWIRCRSRVLLLGAIGSLVSWGSTTQALHRGGCTATRISSFPRKTWVFHHVLAFATSFAFWLSTTRTLSTANWKLRTSMSWRLVSQGNNRVKASGKLQVLKPPPCIEVGGKSFIIGLNVIVGPLTGASFRSFVVRRIGIKL